MTREVAVVKLGICGYYVCFLDCKERTGVFWSPLPRPCGALLGSPLTCSKDSFLLTSICRVLRWGETDCWGRCWAGSAQSSRTGLRDKHKTIQAKKNSSTLIKISQESWWKGEEGTGWFRNISVVIETLALNSEEMLKLQILQLKSLTNFGSCSSFVYIP